MFSAIFLFLHLLCKLTITLKKHFYLSITSGILTTTEKYSLIIPIMPTETPKRILRITCLSETEGMCQCHGTKPELTSSVSFGSHRADGIRVRRKRNEFFWTTVCSLNTLWFYQPGLKCHGMARSMHGRCSCWVGSGKPGEAGWLTVPHGAGFPSWLWRTHHVAEVLSWALL